MDNLKGKSDHPSNIACCLFLGIFVIFLIFIKTPISLIFIRPITFLPLIFIVICFISSIASYRANNSRKSLNKEYTQMNNPYKLKSNPHKSPNEKKKEMIPEIINSPMNENAIVYKRYCPYCGERLERRAIFCHMCGNLVSSNVNTI